MKKFFLMLLFMFLLTGCTDLMNNPIKRTEEYFSKYQTLDDKVLIELDEVIAGVSDLSNDNKELYNKAMKRQYQNLVYDIKDEKVDGKRAEINTQIKVFNYGKVIDEATLYINENPAEFKVGGTLNKDLTDRYKLESLLKTDEKIEYFLIIYLTNVEDIWSIDGIDESDRKKIQGVYKF